MARRTRIVATLGPSTDGPGVLESMLELGLDVARINFSHGDTNDHIRRVQRFRELSKKAGRHTAVLADLPGPKLRCLLDKPLPLANGQNVHGRRRGRRDDRDALESGGPPQHIRRLAQRLDRPRTQERKHRFRRVNCGERR